MKRKFSLIWLCMILGIVFLLGIVSIGNWVSAVNSNYARLDTYILNGSNASSFGDATLAMQNSIYARVDNAYSATYEAGGYSENYPYCFPDSCVSGWTDIGDTYCGLLFNGGSSWRICSCNICALAR